MKRRTKIVLGVLGLLVVAQVVRFKHENPPVTGEIVAPPAVMEVLKRACYDCHSNQTVWPWYSQIAPASWLVYRDVVVGRKHLNFSEWNALPPEKQRRKLRSTARETSEGEMPPWFYLPLHGEARLSDADKKTLSDWAAAGGGG